jgi:5-hydroxyisourate hydrolase
MAARTWPERRRRFRIKRQSHAFRRMPAGGVAVFRRCHPRLPCCARRDFHAHSTKRSNQDARLAKLSTHVLDTMHGRPAAGMALALHRLRKDGMRDVVTATMTNADGRTDAPLLAGEAIVPGEYELVFKVDDYFRASGIADAGRFLTSVPLRFRIDDPAGNYHVPLLVSPWSYSTYRGS